MRIRQSLPLILSAIALSLVLLAYLHPSTSVLASPELDNVPQASAPIPAIMPSFGLAATENRAISGYVFQDLVNRYVTNSNKVSRNAYA
jgi:hypothetical protein